MPSMPLTDAAVSIDDIRDAARRLTGHVLRTPAVFSPWLSQRLDAEVYLKLENLQFTGSFKVRGAYIKLASLSPEQRRAGVVAASAGNHAQGVAFHAAKLGIKATIFMPEPTPFTKIGRTEALGATVVLAGADLKQAHAAAMDACEQDGSIYVPPYDDPAIIAGQGTFGLEFLEDVPDLDTLVIPIGGGGLMAGTAIAAKAVKPDIRLIGVQAALYPFMAQAIGTGNDIEPQRGVTVADGIAVEAQGALTQPVIATHVSEIFLADEGALERAIMGLIENQRVVAEGAGAAGVAALLEHADTFKGRTVGVAICGGNIDSRVLSSILLRGLGRAGRLVRLRIEITDLPGTLAKVSGLIGETGGNIVEVTHQRLFHDVPVKRTDLDVVVETVDAQQAATMLTRLNEAGFAARRLDEQAP